MQNKGTLQRTRVQGCKGDLKARSKCDKTEGHRAPLAVGGGSWGEASLLPVFSNMTEYPVKQGSVWRETALEAVLGRMVDSVLY